MDNKSFRADVKSIVLNNISSIVGTLFMSGVAWIISPNNLPLLGMALLGVPAGTLLGHRSHYIKTLQVRRTYIGCYDSRLEFIDGSTCIDMLAISFAGFYNFQKHVRNAIKNSNAQVRILLCKPHSESLEYFTLKEKGKLAPQMNSEIFDAIQSVIEIAHDTCYITSEKDKHEGNQGSIQYEFYESIPLRGCIITNSIVRYWPYLEHDHPSSCPTYEFSRNGEIGTILSKEFEFIWDQAVLNRSMKRWNVTKIVSGGQTGVDIAALDWAMSKNIPHGGWCPQGRKQEKCGMIDEKYQLVETPSSEYEERTKLNVRDSDATIIISEIYKVELGTRLTITEATKLKKPWLHLCRCNSRHKSHSQNCDELAAFLQKHDTRVLNIAGSRESEASGIGAYVNTLLNDVYYKLGQ